MTETESILVVGPAWVGDMVMAQTLFKSLKRSGKHTQIDVLAPAWSGPLLARMPEVRESIVMPVGHGQLGLNARYQLGRWLRNKHYSRSIVLPRSLKASLVPFFAKIPRRTGYRGEMRFGLINDMRHLNKAAHTRMIERYVSLASDKSTQLQITEDDYPRLTIDRDNAQRLMSEFGLQNTSLVVGLMPGAEYGPSKQWPVEYFAKLADRLGKDGIQAWVFGSEKDRITANQIIALAECDISNLCGSTSLVDAVDLLSEVDVAVSNDSGLMHVAAATGVPVVGIYGATTPLYTPPLTSRSRILYEELACSPCWQRTCQFGHYNCLRDIGVEDAYRAVESLQKYGNAK